MQLPVGLSILAHGVVLFAALWLPAARKSHDAKPIEIEVNRVQPVEPAAPPQAVPVPEPEPEAPKPKLAMRTPIEREREPKPETPEPPKPETPEPPKPQTPPPPSSQSPRSSLSPRAPQIDLRLHALPGSGGELSFQSAQPGHATSGRYVEPGQLAAAPRKPWKPKLDAGDPITGKIAEVKEEEFPLTSMGREGWVYKGPQFSAHILLDGTVSFDDKIIRDFKGLSGSFDINDWAMKGKKEDPYRHQKKKFMAATQTLRDKLQREARAAEIERSIAILPDRLAAIMLTHRSPREKRALIYRQWKETVDADDDRQDGAARARQIIEEFVRQRFPEGSPDAFTADELASFGRGDGRLRFDPYR